MLQKQRLLIQPRLRPHQVRVVLVAAVLYLLLNWSFLRDVNGIVNALNAEIVPRHWIQSLLAMVLTRKSIARHAMARNGDHMDMDMPVVLVSCKLME
jgi:hypothetical protein